MRRLLTLAAPGVALLAMTVGVRAGDVRKAASQPLAVLSAPPAGIDLASGWRYRPDPQNAGVESNWGQGGAPATGWTPVTLPNDFNPTVSSASDQGAVAWYETTFTGPQLVADRSWAVWFEGARRHTRVWLNGFEIGGSSDPYSPFQVPAGSLQPGAPNLLVVRVDNFRGGSFPEDWWNWGGITGPVKLVPVGRVSLLDLGVVPQLGCGLRCAHLLVQGTLINRIAAPVMPRLVLDLVAPGGGIAARVNRALGTVGPGNSTSFSFSVTVRGTPALWSPSDPALYQVQAAATLGHSIEDIKRLHVGMRSVSVRAGVLYLNGQRLWLHGAAIHEDISGDGAALTDGDINTIVSELRSAGANVTRAHYALSERLLNALDAAGILVWEQPTVDHADSELRTAAGRTQALQMLRRTVLIDRNHPSVVFNSVGNELSPTPDTTAGTATYLRAAIALARALDPATLISLDTYCYPGYPAQKLYRQLDVLGIDSYFGWYPGLPGHSISSFGGLRPFLVQSRARYPRQALVISEYGAEGLYSGPATTKGTYQFQSDYLARTLAVINQLPYMNGSIYWTLREFAVQPGWTGGATLPAGDVPDGLHHKGLIAYDGSDKPAFAVAQKLFAQLPRFVH